MHLGWFEGYTVLGAMLYTSIMCVIGYFLGENFDLAIKIATRLGYVGTALFVLLFAFLLFGGRELSRKRVERVVRDVPETGQDDIVENATKSVSPTGDGEAAQE